MRIMFLNGTDVKKMVQEKILPMGVKVHTDEESGRQYFNWMYRVSTNIDLEKLRPFIEAASNIVRSYCDFREEGIYFKDGIQITVILKVDSNGKFYDEIEIYSKNSTPEKMSQAFADFCAGKISITMKWSSGIPYECK